MPPDVQAHIAGVVSELAQRDWPVRWVAAESAHLTLHFVGETAPERAELLRMGLASVVARQESFTLTTGDFGVFPDFRKPRVLWVGLRGQTDRLAALHREVGLQLQRLGFEADLQRFHPHITLGRVRDNPPATLGANVQQAFDDPAIVQRLLDRPLTVEVDEILLIRSFLERGGSRHVPIARYPLGRGGRE